MNPSTTPRTGVGVRAHVLMCTLAPPRSTSKKPYEALFPTPGIIFAIASTF